jgi:hypothetical protein
LPKTVRSPGVMAPLCETDVGPIAPRRQGFWHDSGTIRFHSRSPDCRL